MIPAEGRGQDIVTDRPSRPPPFHPLVAIFNSREEVIESVRSALESEGFSTVAARLAEIQSGTLDLVAFVETHDPDVIVYDLPRPYENHWNFLRLLKETSSLKDRAWIVTTTDKEALVAAVGAVSVVEIIVGQPYGASDVVDAVHVALAVNAPTRAQRDV
jgi:CheY-like chemotaxis protein